MKSDRNYLIRNIPDDTDRILNSLALLRGLRKWEVTREALVEYADRHRGDIAKLSKAQKNNG